MALMRWEPASDIETMRRQMDSLMGRLLGRGMGMGTGLDVQALLPNVEVYTTDNEVVVKAELAGMKPEDVEVEITEDSVHLHGENKREEEIQEDNYYHSERQFGRFDRVVSLPNRIKDDQAKASFKNGLLTIRAPLAEQVKRPQSHKLRIES